MKINIHKEENIFNKKDTKEINDKYIKEYFSIGRERLKKQKLKVVHDKKKSGLKTYFITFICVIDKNTMQRQQINLNRKKVTKFSD